MTRINMNLNVVNALARSARNRASDLNEVTTATVPGKRADRRPIYDAYEALLEAVNDLELYLYPRGRNV